MRSLPSDLRKRLETAVVAARRASESAVRSALDGLGVFVEKRPSHLDEEQARLRNGLRAKLRQLGNDRDVLVAECAYEQWHRLLFARFLADTNLLLHPEFKAPVTLEDCEELADELGEPDGWSVAARFAAEILPGIFRLDDPCVQVRLAPEGRHALEQILRGLPPEIFAADDALGWVYQFWQRDKKDEVNASERKIGGADLGPVTQLFTENYMVRFLLENSLGAWWAARHPDSPLVKEFDFLRFDEDGGPAAGSFDGWPDRASEVTVMDPCCGSGHFLVEAFSMLWQMRAEEEGVSEIQAQDAVLRDNLFGLELDPRCVQIAMFAVALQAWKAGGGWRQLPIPNIACSGIPVKAPADEWKTVAGDNDLIRSTLVRLHGLFANADTFGSLIDPPRVARDDFSQRQGSLEDVDWEQARVLLDRVTDVGRDPATAVFGADAASLARAASLLSRGFTLVTTNVPYLQRRNQAALLTAYLENWYTIGKSDLATAFILRMERFAEHGGTVAAVVPNNWTFLTSYTKLREHLLDELRWRFLARLGPRAFGGISGEVVNVVLFCADAARANDENPLLMWDLSSVENAPGKASALRDSEYRAHTQQEQRANPESRLMLEPIGGMARLAQFAHAYKGVTTGDDPRWKRFVWELVDHSHRRFLQSSTETTRLVGGCSFDIPWRLFEQPLLPGVELRGEATWGQRGIAVSLMNLACATSLGEPFDQNVAVVLPTQATDFDALWAFLSSPGLRVELRRLDQKMNVTTGTLELLPFDVDHWRRAAGEAGPLPEPWSDDPTQWLFKGRPEESTAPLQVAIARLVGYRWPEQTESDDLDRYADPDGIVCLPSVAGEPPAAVRVQQVLAAAFGASWSAGQVKQLLEDAGSKKKSITDWLRDEFFKQHCGVFGNRPFVWHVWDGQREGFSALVNYHRLDRKLLEKLTYTYLGQDWIERQRAEARDGIAGAEARLAAAQALQRKLEAILEGEKPYDIYIRWKPLHEQPIGWGSDLNDGVRLNIRPFVEAGVLRASFSINWNKDRGKDPDGSDRINDRHLSLAEKREAREKAGR